jgi:hypothetical protein
MSAIPETAPPVLNPAPAPEKTLRRLFLTLFLRGRSSRRLQLDKAPKSVGEKLALALLFYGLFGLFALSFIGRPVFGLAIYLHSMTFVFLGMFVAASAGEVLFNKEEADILLHRPVTSRDLLWSKIRVLVQVSLWLAGAFNLIGTFVGIGARDGGILFPLVHVVSTALEAVFCTSCVIMVYQLCLRWFGRERLEGLMTTAQVLVAVAAVLAGQILPRVFLTMNGVVTFSLATWWVSFLPPAWFAGMDDAFGGSRSSGSLLLAGLGLVATTGVLWLAFGKLAGDYEAGLQSMGEVSSRPRSARRKRWVNALVNAPPMSWFLRNPVSRASFLLTAAYLARDRDVKLRVYPGLAPMLVMPLIFVLQGFQKQNGFPFALTLAFAGGFLASMPLVAIDFLRYSQQWQASDIFRVAPMTGPAHLCHGCRRAVLCLLILPLVAAMAIITGFAQKSIADLALLLPGLILMPTMALVPAALHRGVPLSHPNEEAKSANRTMIMVVVMMISFALSGFAYWSWTGGWFKWMLLAEILVTTPIYVGLRFVVSRLRWESIDSEDAASFSMGTKIPDIPAPV